MLAPLASSWRPQWTTTVNNSSWWEVRKWSHQFRCQSAFFLLNLQLNSGGPRFFTEVDLAARDRYYEGKLLGVVAGAVNLTHPSSTATIIWLQISELKCAQGWMGGQMATAWMDLVQIVMQMKLWNLIERSHLCLLKSLLLEHVDMSPCLSDWWNTD